MCDLKSVGFGALHKVRLQSRTDRAFQTGSSLSFSGVNKHPFNFVHLEDNKMSKLEVYITVTVLKGQIVYNDI